jgi:hypothetical protein
LGVLARRIEREARSRWWEDDYVSRTSFYPKPNS